MKCSYYHCKNETKNKYCSDDCRVFGRYKTVKPFKKYIWGMYSEYIRRRDSDSFGMVKCVTCPRREHWKEFHAGHYEHGEDPGTKFHDKNVHAQCPQCNLYQSGKRNEYAIFLEGKYGFGILQEIQKAKTYGTWTLPMLRETYKEVKEKLDAR